MREVGCPMLAAPMKATASVVTAWLSLGALVASLAASAPAAACGNSYIQYYVLSGARAQLESAERLLARGQLAAALRPAHEVVAAATEGTAVRSLSAALRQDNRIAAGAWRASVSEEMPQASPPTAAPAADSTALLARARLLRGITIARMNGQLNSALTPLRRATPAQREARFQFALANLDAAVAANPTDPRALAYQVEARARRDPSAAAASRAALRSLAERDVLADPWSWAALARLEEDPARRAAALTRCAALAGRNAATACVP